jgi:hypothetical protein
MLSHQLNDVTMYYCCCMGILPDGHGRQMKGW